MCVVCGVCGVWCVCVCVCVCGTLALPHRTSVPMKATLLREAMSPLVAASWWEVDLEQGLVSPVRLDSSTDRSVACGGQTQRSH